MRALVIAGKILGWTLLAILVLALLVVGGGIVAARTDWGHRKLLAKVLPLIEGQINGKLTIEKIGGTLTGALELDNVELRDVDGQPMARVSRLTASYNLASLLHHTIDLHRVEAEGLWVRLAYLHDGRIDVAALVKPSPPSKNPFKIKVGDLRIAAEVRYEPNHPPAPQEADRSHAMLQLHGGVDINGAVIDIRLDQLTVDSLDPAAGHVEAKGGAHIDGSQLTLRDVGVKVTTDGAQVDRFIPPEYARVMGPLTAVVTASGPLTAMTARLAVTLPKGTLESEATVGVTARGADWKGTLRARDIDPGLAYAGLPHGKIQIDGDGHGFNQFGQIQNARVDIDLTGIRVKAHGDVSLNGTGTAALAVDASDLSTLDGVAQLKKLALGGSLHVDGKVSRHLDKGDHLSLDAKIRGARLRVAGVRWRRRFPIDAHVVDWSGSAAISTEGLVAGGQRFDSLTVNAFGGREQLRLNAVGIGPRQSDFALALHGRRVGSRGVDLSRSITCG